MIYRRNNLVIGLTVSDVAYLQVAVPALARLRRCFFLVIYNDDSCARINRRMVRRLGYRGKLYIINGGHGIGLLGARIELVKYIRAHKIRSDWFMFIHDANIVSGLSIPRVLPNNFAIIQNSVRLRSGFLGALRVMRDPSAYQIDNTNTVLLRPYLGLTGTFVRSGVLFRTIDILSGILDSIYEIDMSLSYPAPVDLMMWSAINIVSRDMCPANVPIYMDTVGVLGVDLDAAPSVSGARIARALSRYDKLVLSALGMTKKSD